MQFRSLGGLKVPVIGMGSASSSGFDVESEEGLRNCREILDNCLAHGCSFLDTSPMYRRAEGVIGGGISGRRDLFQLATKVWCSGAGTGRAQIANSFSLLGTDYIDVLQIHNLVDWRTHLPYLERLRDEGRIGLIGVSHYQPPFYGELAAVMRTGRVDVIQVPYSLLEREAEQELLPLAEELGVGVIVMRPLVKGAVVSGLKRQPDMGPLREWGLETWGQAALAWILADARVSTLIPATSRPQRIAENAAAGSVTLPPEMRGYIEREAQRCL